MNKDIPKGASMIEIMQIGQLEKPYEIGHFSKQFTTPEERQKAFEERQKDLAESMQEDIERGGNASGNDFLTTQFRYDGVDDPNHKKEI